MKRFILSLVFILFFISTCRKSPFNALVPPIYRQSFDAELAAAQAYYDEEKIDQALIHAEAAYQLNPTSEEAAMILGYCYLGKVGITPMGLVEKMMASEKKEDPDDQDKKEASTSPLGPLEGIIGVTEDEFLQLGSKNITDPELPVIIPKCAGEAREAVKKLNYITKAIRVACSFVDRDIRIKDEDRHKCLLTKGPRKHRTMMHILWAFSHLIEALAFNSVLIYSTTNTGKINLEMRVNKIADFEITDPAQIPQFVLELQDLTLTLDLIFPATGICKPKYPQNQVVALINDLLSVSFAFTTIKGIPPEMTKTIQDMTLDLRRIQQKTRGANAKQAQVELIKQNFTKVISNILSDKINLLNPADLSDQHISEICTAYRKVRGTEENDLSTPTMCLLH